MWIELKRVHDTCSNKFAVQIPWRPGQQAWLSDVQQRGVKCLTIACFNDGIIMIKHDRIYEKNIVGTCDMQYYKDIRSLLA